MKKLYDICIDNLLMDSDLLCLAPRILPKPLLFDLVRKSLPKPVSYNNRKPSFMFDRTKSSLQSPFEVLIKNWQYDVFSLDHIGIQLGYQHIVILNSMIRDDSLGCICNINLYGQKNNKELTDAVLTTVLKNRIDLEEKERICDDPIQIWMTVCIHDCERYIEAQNVNSKIKLFAQGLHLFDFTNLIYVLKCTDLNYLKDINMRLFPNMDASIFEELFVFTEVQRLTIHFIHFDGHKSLLVEFLSRLDKLEYLDFSYCRTGIITDVIREGIKSDLDTLILTGCNIDSNQLNNLFSNKKLNNLVQLELAANENLSLTIEEALKILIAKCKHSLKHLDLSYCNIEKAKIIELCPLFMQFDVLTTLVIRPNPEVTKDSILHEISPLFQSKHVEIV